MFLSFSEPFLEIKKSWKPPEILELHLIAPHPTFNLERMLGVPDGVAIEVADLRKMNRNVEIFGRYVTAVKASINVK